MAAAAVFLAAYFWPKNSTPLPEQNVCPDKLHYSYFSTQPFFDEAYKNAPATPPQNAPVKGVIVNHHLLAANLIAQTIGAIATQAPVTVVLISPNHFYAGRGQIISSMYKWKTPYGILDSDCGLISKLAVNGVLTVDESPFVKEHGISGIVPFVKRSLPNSRVVPVIVKETASQKDIDNFVDSLFKDTGRNILVIGSFDFSHEVTPGVAEIQDKKSTETIKNFNYAGLKTMAVDSRRGLEMEMKYLQKAGAGNFNLVANTNSARIINEPNSTNTTSYITGTFSMVK